MTKITTKITALIRKLALIAFSGFNRKYQLAKSFGTKECDKRNRNNGERRLHVYPETGEVYLSAALYQFELERARASAVA